MSNYTESDYFISQSVTLLTPKLKKCVAHFSNISNEIVKKNVLSQICTLFDIFRDAIVSVEQLKIFHQL